MLAKDVLKSARYILSDTSVSRWTDERLLALLNDGLADIAKTTILFIDTLWVPVINNVVDYDLSDKVIKIHRVEYMDEVIEQRTFEEMDSVPFTNRLSKSQSVSNGNNFGDNLIPRSTKWQQDKGTRPLAIIYNKQSQGQFKIYPIVENANNTNYIFNQLYGIITGISYSEVQFITADLFGDLGALEQLSALKLYYTRKHPKITDINAEIEIDDLALEPLAHYIAGRALRDNADVQNRSMGNEELEFYKNSLSDYSIEKANNFGTRVHETEYRPL